MKNIFKYSLALLTLVLGFASCSDSDDNYTPGSVSGPQIFFDKDMTTTVNLTFNDTKFSIPVTRANAGEAVSVNITKEDKDNLFAVPANVSFAAGEKDATIEIGLDPSKFEYNDYKQLTLTIDPEMGTPYGIGTVTLKVGMPLTYKSLGKGTYIDNWFEHTAEVEIQQCEQNPNVFRVKKPYASYDGDDYFDMSGEMDEYLELTVQQPGDVFNGVEITEKDLVTFPIYSTGAIHPSYTDDVIVMLHPSEYSSMATDQTQWAHNKVLEYDANGTPARIQLAPSYYMMKYGGWNNTQNDGIILIYFPGNDPIYYDLAFEYTGRFTDTSNNDFALGTITLGADLESAKYVVVDSEDKIDAAIASIVDGSNEEAIEITKTSDISIPLTETGKYYVVIVGFAGGEAVSADAFMFKFQSSKDTTETWTAAFIGTYVYGAKSYTQGGALFYDQVYTDEGLTLFQSDSNPNRYRIAPLWASETGMIFEMNDDNTLVVDGVETGHVDDTYGMICVSDFVTYGAADMPSYYENGVFNFYLAYHVPAGTFAYVLDTFTLTAEAAAQLKATKRVAANKSVNIKNAKYVRMNKPVEKANLR